MWQPFEWVNVKDRLPCAVNGEYQMLICDQFGSVSAGFWNGRLQKFLDEPMGWKCQTLHTGLSSPRSAKVITLR